MKALSRTPIYEMEYSPNPIRKVLSAGYIGDFPYLIMNFGHHPCCYIGVPENHTYWGKAYDEVNLDVHGYCTFSEQAHNALTFDFIPPKYWVLGWDYGHFNDFSGIYLYEHDRLLPFYERERKKKKWTIKELLKDVEQAALQLDTSKWMRAYE